MVVIESKTLYTIVQFLEENKAKTVIGFTARHADCRIMYMVCHILL